MVVFIVVCCIPAIFGIKVDVNNKCFLQLHFVLQEDKAAVTRVVNAFNYDVISVAGSVVGLKFSPFWCYGRLESLLVTPPPNQSLEAYFDVLDCPLCSQILLGRQEAAIYRSLTDPPSCKVVAGIQICYTAYTPTKVDGGTGKCSLIMMSYLLQEVQLGKCTYPSYVFWCMAEGLVAQHTFDGRKVGIRWQSLSSKGYSCFFVGRVSIQVDFIIGLLPAPQPYTRIHSWHKCISPTTLPATDMTS